ncbi:MAG TPA: DUF998 domain-containing protein [Propionibacteriaceae bacterium]|nr:DUF998 domain-containing protein [Propionibacteriaceae bacterium]
MSTTKITTGFTTTPGAGPRRPRWAAWAGIVGPLLFTAGFLAQQVYRGDDFDSIVQPVSALEAGTQGWIQQANFVMLGALLLVFSAGLHRGLVRTRYGVVGPALLACAAIGLFVAAAVPLREDAAGQVYDPGGHFVSGVTFFLGTALALLVLSGRLAKDPHFRSLAGYAAICGVSALVGFVVMARFAMPDNTPLHAVAGLIQRVVFVVVIFPCFIALALRLRPTGSG